MIYLSQSLTSSILRSLSLSLSFLRSLSLCVSLSFCLSESISIYLSLSLPHSIYIFVFVFFTTNVCHILGMFYVKLKQIQYRFAINFGSLGIQIIFTCFNAYVVQWVTQVLPQKYTANNATFPIQIRIITVHICGNFWVTRYIFFFFFSLPNGVLFS